jgi:proline dehydrogenase
VIAPWLRRLVLGIGKRPEIEQHIRYGRLPRSMVRRFVAGDSLAEALAVCRSLREQGLMMTLDLLGENVRTMEAARVATESYEATLRALRAAGFDPYISVKLTMLGLDLGEQVAQDNMIALLGTAREVAGFVRIDMESSAYTDRTLAMTEALHDEFPDRVGTVVQAYLHRSDRDLERLIQRRVRVRLVKGAYDEPSDVALQRPREIDAAFVRFMERLLEAGPYPAIATHDPALIRATRGFAVRLGIPRDRWEFQMLYGVRRDAQLDLARAGYRMRVYVPFGPDWYPYFVRRIAERPANALFVLRQLVQG